MKVLAPTDQAVMGMRRRTPTMRWGRPRPAVLIKSRVKRGFPYSTVTDLAKLRGKSTLRPSKTASQ